ncbi:hypothetical protein Tco_1049379 [Tanacetum coccineum]
MIVSWIYVLLRRRAFVLDPFETSSGTVGQDLNLSTERLTSNKAFTNKLWNASKFVLQNLPDRSDASAWETLLAHKINVGLTIVYKVVNGGRNGGERLGYRWKKKEVRVGEEEVITERLMTLVMGCFFGLWDPYDFLEASDFHSHILPAAHKDVFGIDV